MSDYIGWLRSRVGHEKVILVFAGGCIFNEKGEVLLQKRGSGGWGFPGGAIEVGESIEAAAVREVREETGLDVEVVRLIGVYSDPDMTYPNGDQAHSICIGLEFRVRGGALACDGSETLALRYFPLNQAPKLFCKQHEDLLNDVRNGCYGMIR